MRTLDQFQNILIPLRQQLFNSYQLHAEPSLQEILEAHPRLVVVFNHSTPLSWIPAMCILATAAAESGHGDRVPMGIMDRFFYSVPGLSQIAKYISQSEQPLTFEEWVERFKQKERADLVIFPEGSNCFFGNPEEIQEFRSPRFIEIAMRTQTPILLAVHRGSESWAKAISIPQEILNHLSLLPQSVQRRLTQTGLLTLPLIPQKINRFHMHTELFIPDGALNVGHEAERLRTRMTELFEKIQ